MRTWLGCLTVAALAAGSEVLSTGCGRALRAPGRDAGGKTDVASTTGGVVGTGGRVGVGGGTAMGGSAGVDGGANDGEVGANVDATEIDPEQFCELWQRRASEEDTLEVQRHGLFEAGTVLTGTLGDFVESGDASYAFLSVERVGFGMRSYEGLASAMRIERALYDQIGKGNKVIVGFRSPHPMVDVGSGLPLWDQPQALLPQSSPVDAELLGFHAWHTPNVAVVRVDELHDGGIRFTVVESLRGELSGSLVVSLSSYWPALVAAPGSVWIGGFSEPIEPTSGSGQSASLLDLRPDTSDERAVIASALASLAPAGFATRYQAVFEQAKADAIDLRLGWLYHQADGVASLEVTGIGQECCTNAGGIFHVSSVVESLSGPALTGQVLTGGHGYYGSKACGDRFLYAFGAPIVYADGLAVDCQGRVTVGDGNGSRVLHEREATEDSLALARRSVASAPPLLRLYPADAQIPAAAFAKPAGPALWSTPVSARTAAMAGTPALLTITSVTKQAEGYVVRLRTPFYTSELSHLEQHEVEVGFACADPRLLEVGARWLGAVVGTEVIHATLMTTPLAQGHLFLMPGFLLPERSDLIRALGLLPTVSVD